MRALLPLGMVLCALTGGCAMSLPDAAPYPITRPSLAPGSAPSDLVPGQTYCARTAIAARSLSSAQAAGGWTLGALGVASTGTGIFATLVNDQEPRRLAAAGLVLGGVAMGIVAYNLFLRSSASARLAEASDLAMLEKNDRRAYDTCVRIKAAWTASKTDAEAINRELLDERERENRRLREEVEQLRKRAGDEKKAPADPPHP